MAEFQLGSISTGTLRTEDLLPTFTHALRSLPWKDGQRPASEIFSELILEAEHLVGTTGWETMNPEDSGVAGIMEDLGDALQECCPPFVYFGTLEGDGADFGFWPDMDRLNEELQWERDHYPDDSVPDELTLDNDGVIVQVSDHGNVTVMDLDRNVLWRVV